ncbi:MBL fold metallo-hydrolase [Janthinobacterium sp. GB4P2]|uniref:MBL fold metallo-hydrolase n=1 Tax=Janthinobacterium sp. GB4P2 TaxID=3424189 RepID=UPI003F2800B9
MYEQTTTLVTLRAGVRLIPMVNSWYATPLLVSPLTFGLVTKRSHLPLISSYIDSPDVHQQCVATPELRGGPFVDYSGDPAAVAALANFTYAECAGALRVADAIESLFVRVDEEGTGGSLRRLYDTVDASLAGCVEFHYDAYKRPGIRFIESTIYSRMHAYAKLQTCRLEHVTKDERPFFLSTPLLTKGHSTVDIHAPFGAPIWDTLYRRQPLEMAAVIEQVTPYLADPDRDIPVLLEMFTPQLPDKKPHGMLPTGAARVRYFGHACVLFENASTSVLIDPLISYPGESDIERFTFDDLPKHIDYVLITHAHVDHFVLETLLQLRHKVGCVVVGRASGGSLQDISLKLVLENCGFDNVIELSEHEKIVFEGGVIVGAPFFGEHADLDIRAKMTFGVTLGESTCAFFADSNPPHPDYYAHFKSMLPPLDCIFIGMECVGAPASWSYGPLLQRTLSRAEDQSRRLDGSDAKTAIALQAFFAPKRMFVYAMGAEPWVTHLSSIVYSEDLPQFKQARIFERTAKENGKHAEVLFGKMELVLAPRA